MVDIIYSLLKNKNCLQFQKRLYNIVNNEEILSRIDRKQNISYIIENEIILISNDFLNFHKSYFDEYDTSSLFLIQKTFLSLVSKTYHNKFIQSFKEEDEKYSIYIKDLNKININWNEEIKYIFKDKKDDEHIKEINKFKNNFYFYQSSQSKLNSITELFKFFNLYNLDKEKDNLLNFTINIITYIIIKLKLYKIYSNIMFIKNFIFLRILTTEEYLYLLIFEKSLENIKILHSKYISYNENNNECLEKHLDSEQENIINNHSLLNYDYKILKNKCFQSNFKDLNFNEIIGLYNDFKIILKTIESIKYELK